MKARKYLAAVLFLLFALSTPYATGTKEARIIRIAVWGSAKSPVYREIEAAFNSKYKDMQVNIEMQGDFWTYLNAKLAAKEAPDIFYCSSYGNMVNFAKAGHLMDLTNEPCVQRVPSSTKEPNTYNGKVYGLPLQVLWIGMIYNTDLFKKAGILDVPRTLSSLEDACRKIKAIGVTPFAVGYKDGWIMFQAIGGMMANRLGSDANIRKWAKDMNEEKSSFKQANGIEGVMQCIDIINRNCNEKPMDSDYTNMAALVGKQQAAIFINGQWSLGDVKQVNPNISLGVFGFPVSEDPKDAKLTVDNEISLCINANTRYPKEARMALERLVDPSDKGMWLHYLVTEMAGIPTVAYAEAPDQSAAGPQAAKYRSEGAIVPYLSAMAPFGFENEWGGIIQLYVSGAITMNEFLKQSDDCWFKNARQSK